MNQRVPPAYVPTLTEVVPPPPPAALQTPPEPEAQALVARVMRRVDEGLEDQLREAVTAVVLEHTRDLMPALRAEIEAVVRRSVAQALADETDSTPGG
ncbi:MAG TPA: hypothetical protein VLJ86_18645 [Ramlibacter sp.]|nr:hypothetical protein [Ramlibacter sp.]